MDAVEAFADGIYEAHEQVEIRSLTIINRGNGPVPSARYSFGFRDGKFYQIDMPQFAPGETKEVPLNPPMKFVAARLSSGLPVALFLNHLRTPLGASPEISRECLSIVEELMAPF